MNQWERQSAEPIQWYERFTRYRLMGMGRSIRKVLEAENQRPKNIPGNWLRMAEKWNWRERAEAWDFAEIEAQRMRDEEAFRQELQAHRENALAVVREGLAMSLDTAKLINLRLNAMIEKMESGDFEWIEISELPNFMRAFAAVASASLDCEALVLQVSELLLKIDNQQEPA